MFTIPPATIGTAVGQTPLQSPPPTSGEHRGEESTTQRRNRIAHLIEEAKGSRDKVPNLSLALFSLLRSDAVRNEEFTSYIEDCDKNDIDLEGLSDVRLLVESLARRNREQSALALMKSKFGLEMIRSAYIIRENNVTTSTLLPLHVAVARGQHESVDYMLQKLKESGEKEALKIVLHDLQ